MPRCLFLFLVVKIRNKKVLFTRKKQKCNNFSLSAPAGSSSSPRSDLTSTVAMITRMNAPIIRRQKTPTFSHLLATLSFHQTNYCSIARPVFLRQYDFLVLNTKPLHYNTTGTSIILNAIKATLFNPFLFAFCSPIFLSLSFPFFYDSSPFLFLFSHPKMRLNSVGSAVSSLVG